MTHEGFKEEWKWNDPDPDSTGVLLSDRILNYVSLVKLIDPFDVKDLGPATYTLHAGNEFWRDDEPQKPNDRNEIIVPQNGLIYLKIAEQLNLPYYIVGLHDLRVKNVYRGFLAGRSLLVDPGYSGHINYPLYNFTNTPKVIKVGDPVTTICFMKTTPFGSKRFWSKAEISSVADLKGASVSGINGKSCLVQFPKEDRPIHEYWISGETHRSSVQELEKSVKSVVKRWKTYRNIAIIAVLSLIVSVTGILLKHHYWTSNNIIAVNRDVSEVRSSIELLRADFRELKERRPTMGTGENLPERPEQAVEVEE